MCGGPACAGGSSRKLASVPHRPTPQAPGRYDGDTMAHDFSNPLNLQSGALQRPEGQFPVRPVPEYLADGDLLPAYADLKAALGVPWVGVITQAVAHYRPFFLQAWAQFSANAKTAYFAHRCDHLRELALEQVQAHLPATPQRARLRAMGYSERELAQIAATLDVFNAGNPAYLVLATAIKESLCFGRRLGGTPASPQDLLPRAAVHPIGAVPVMVEPHHAGPDVLAVYGRIKATLNLPFVNSDYKAMARWPSYLQLAWGDLEPLVGHPAYNAARQQVHAAAVATVAQLPHAYTMRHAEALAAGLSDEQAQELMRVISLFQWLLSGLIVNVTQCRLALSS